MKFADFEGAGKIDIKEVAKPTIQQDDDVIIKVLRTCVCGSDMWSYKGLEEHGHENDGHEVIGIVEEVGATITTVAPGDFVIAPFTHGCGHCRACVAGYDGTCMDHSLQDNFSSGYQAEYVRYQHAQWALVKVSGKPSDYSEGMKKSLLTLADVMATGYHAARVAHVKPGDTVVVLGDGAVGLCAIIAAKLRGAKQIVATSRHADKAALAREFGATDNVAERGDDGVKKLLEVTNGGADAILECVGTAQSNAEAMQIGRPGSYIGRVGLPHGAELNPAQSFYTNSTIAGGPASVTTYDKEVLLKAVLDGEINPGKVFDKTFTLDQINDAYQAMADHQAIKSYVVVADD